MTSNPSPIEMPPQQAKQLVQKMNEFRVGMHTTPDMTFDEKCDAYRRLYFSVHGRPGQQNGGAR